MSEWLKEHAWRACERETAPRVRIPASPPTIRYVMDERAPIAQVDRAADYESVGQRFESSWAHHFSEEEDFRFMVQALEEAKKGAEEGEVPVGAVLVSPQGEEVARAHNCPVKTADPTAHAEVLVLREGARKLRNYRLVGSTLYVTLEPCAMCAGAILQARIGRLVFALRDPKAGAVVSGLRLLDDPRANHRVELSEGLLSEECRRLLRSFFQERRRSSKIREEQKNPASGF